MEDHSSLDLIKKKSSIDFNYYDNYEERSLKDKN